jgi:hypothetical protein
MHFDASSTLITSFIVYPRDLESSAMGRGGLTEQQTASKSITRVSALIMETPSQDEFQQIQISFLNWHQYLQ